MELARSYTWAVKLSEAIEDIHTHVLEMLARNLEQ